MRVAGAPAQVFHYDLFALSRLLIEPPNSVNLVLERSTIL